MLDTDKNARGIFLQLMLVYDMVFVCFDYMHDVERQRVRLVDITKNSNYFSIFVYF